MIGMYFTYSQVIDQPGRLIKVVAYPKWQFTCIVLFDVEVSFCCTPSNVTNVIKCRCKNANVKKITVSEVAAPQALNK